MPVTSSRPSVAAPAVVAALLPIIAVVFIAFPVIGLTLPVLPLHAPLGLDLSTFVVSVVNPEVSPPASDDCVIFGRGCPVQGGFSRERGKSLAGLACACWPSAARRASVF
jgi:hypothetical protein